MTDLGQLEGALRARASNKCELCGGGEGLGLYEVGPVVESSLERSVLSCAFCQAQLGSDASLDVNHWYCLQSSIWSEVPAVQVVSWRTLHRLSSESWAQDLLEQAYLEESVLEWARAGVDSPDDDDDELVTLDSNGTRLLEGDTVTLIKDLDVKGTSFVAKRGTTVKNIHLTGNPEHIEGKVNKMSIDLKTCFLKKIS